MISEEFQAEIDRILGATEDDVQAGRKAMENRSLLSIGI